ncbi:Aste57867_24868 [Aphanomyces stellatus]|uniref:Aste57867_24868 protein n=1 Tax=Aphanomyces stellatus TaxID=120398 RepID=A0A485LRL3_9STRA|nr:hypothetical protein As57867_024790 [Aphanomyces stellatus]VFU01502.1 Aste57867_24868 [Aphanomyces stellatus]
MGHNNGDYLAQLVQVLKNQLVELKEQNTKLSKDLDDARAEMKDMRVAHADALKEVELRFVDRLKAKDDELLRQREDHREELHQHRNELRRQEEEHRNERVDNTMNRVVEANSASRRDVVRTLQDAGSFVEPPLNPKKQHGIALIKVPLNGGLVQGRCVAGMERHIDDVLARLPPAQAPLHVQRFHGVAGPIYVRNNFSHSVNELLKQARQRMERQARQRTRRHISVCRFDWDDNEAPFLFDDLVRTFDQVVRLNTTQLPSDQAHQRAIDAAREEFLNTVRQPAVAA